MRAIITLLYLFGELQFFGSFADESPGRDFSTVNPRIYDLQRRRRRDINSSVYYEVESKLKIVELGDWVLELDVDHNIFPLGKSEWITDDGIKYASVEVCEHRSGLVRGFKESSAAVTICKLDVTGYFTTRFKAFFIEPTNGSHVLYETLPRKLISRYKRSLQSGQWEYFNLTGDVIDIGPGKEINEVEWESNEILEDFPVTAATDWKRERIDSEDLGYFFDTAWEPNLITRKKNAKQSGNPHRWLEIAVATDNTVIAFHGKKRVEQYVLTLMNIVNAIYQDPSLDANINLVITRLLLYEHKKMSVVRPGHAKKSLENVNIWNRGLHISLAPGETHHDVAIWITRSDIGGPSGYAPVSGACDPERSCALNRDEGLTSAFIIAHEMAHILGLSHDGDKKMSNDCGDQALQGSVMAPMVSATFHQFLWSDCSRKEFQRKAGKWTCLLNAPSGTQEIALNSTLQTSFSMDEQCRMEFGEGYSLCRSFDIVEPCSHLWCGHSRSPLVCKTKKGPPLEGTECGFDKWCVNGYCEIVDRQRFNINPVQHNPQDGGWSDWSPWGPCSRSCGTGVEFRVRKCDNPLPIYGGSDCFGLKEEWRICSLKTCPEPIRDIRAQQCRRLTKFLKLKPPRSNMTWLPYESEQYEMKCKLICTSKETKELYITGENLIDGTPCSYENRSNICIQGICQLLGCDMKVFSTKREDVCGICGGDNSECTKVVFALKRKLKKDLSRVAVFPRLSREIKVETNISSSSSDSSVAFILKDRKRNSYSITIPNTITGNQIIEGTKFYYKKILGTHVLWAKGPVLAEIVLLAYASSSQIESGINISSTSEYYIQKAMLNESTKYQWIAGGWGPCSKSCGGGRRFKTKACWDIPNNKIVPRKFCSIFAKPNATSERCNNFSCSFVWVPGKWEPCSKTCGSYGVQFREIYCIPQSLETYSSDNVLEEPWKFMVSPNKCGDVQPATSRSCAKRPCPSYWEYGDWSQCSSSCGLGISVRQSFCLKPENETLYSCSELGPMQRKFCRKKINGNSCPKKTCHGDYSKYCSLSLLSHYCEIGKFRKLCCKSCFVQRLTPFSY